MKYEWPTVALVVLPASLFLLTREARVSVILGGVSLFVGYMAMWYAIYHGRTTRKVRLGVSREEQTYELHRLFIAAMTTFILIGVLGIEIGVRKLGGLWGNPWFVVFHLALVGGMVATFLRARWYTGEHDHVKHRKVVYWFATFYTAALITGIMLIVDMPFPQVE